MRLSCFWRSAELKRRSASRPCAGTIAFLGSTTAQRILFELLFGVSLRFRACGARVGGGANRAAGRRKIDDSSSWTTHGSTLLFSSASTC